MLFKIDKDKPVIDQNPEIAAFEKIPLLTDRQLRWMLLVHDYGTPLRKLPMEERMAKACDMVGYKREKDSGRHDKNARELMAGKSPRMNEALVEFMGIQYDQDKELMVGYDIQIADAIELMKKKDKSDKDWTILTKLNKELPGILRAKKELETTVGFRSQEESSSDDEEEPLSALDRFHEND